MCLVLSLLLTNFCLLSHNIDKGLRFERGKGKYGLSYTFPSVSFFIEERFPNHCCGKLIVYNMTFSIVQVSTLHMGDLKKSLYTGSLDPYLLSNLSLIEISLAINIF